MFVTIVNIYSNPKKFTPKDIKDSRSPKEKSKTKS